MKPKFLERWNSFTKVKTIQYEVNGQPLTFAPIKIRTLMDLRDVGQDIATCLTSIFYPERGTTTTVHRNFGKDGADGGETILQAMSVEMKQELDNKRQMAITRLVDTLLNPQNQTILATIILDSLRFDTNLFEDIKDLDGVSKQSLVGDLDASTLTQLIFGIIKASAGGFGPLDLNKWVAKIPELAQVLPKDSEKEVSNLST